MSTLTAGQRVTVTGPQADSVKTRRGKRLSVAASGQINMAGTVVSADAKTAVVQLDGEARNRNFRVQDLTVAPAAN